MKIPESNYRFERKWLFSNNYFDLYNKLLKSKFMFRKMYPERKIHSIYFDDFLFSSVRQNLEGESEKFKIRLRWYGQNSEILNYPKLEFKIKKNFMNRKIIKDMPNLHNLNIKNIKDIIFINKIVNSVYKKKVINPVSTTNYTRSYFISNNSKIRSTVDRNFKVSRFYNNLHIPIYKKFHKVILEMKYNKNYDNYVINNVTDISNRFSRNSKYINSIIYNFR